MIVFHDDPFTPFDRSPQSRRSPGEGPGIRRFAAIPDEWIPGSSQAARLRVGARALDSAQWVSPVDIDWEPTLSMKRALVVERPVEVVGMIATDGIDQGCAEACEEASAGVLGSVGAPLSMGAGIDALVDAALAVADDLCILEPGPTPRLVAAVLCSPNRWRLADKLGGAMSAIHAPVARYDTDLSSPVDAMLARLSPDRPVWRINWGLSNHPALFQPDTPPHTPEMDPSQMWLRIEWQTLRRLPVTGAILFGIRTYVQRLEEFATRPPALVHDFADLVRALPEDVATYKSIAPYRSALFDWLSSIA